MATPNIKPNADGEGQLGIIGRLWKWLRVVNMYVTGNITDGVNTVTVAQIAGSLGMNIIGPQILSSLLTADPISIIQDNYTPFETAGILFKDSNVVYLFPTVDLDITGIDSTGVTDGQNFLIVNLGVGQIKFLNLNGGSLMGNRIAAAGDIKLDQYEMTRMVRVGAISKWTLYKP